MSDDVIDSGAKVRLKTGGPAMTVGQRGKADQRGKIECSWFDKNERSHSDFFHPTQLEIIPDEDDVPLDMMVG